MEAEDRGNSGDVAFSDSHGDGEASAAMTKLLGTMPDCAWENVASFAAPSDCYNIALASRRFFQPVSCSPVPQQRGDQEPRRKSKRQKTAGSPPLLLATRMLRVSLEHNLERVLKHSRSGITLESLKKLGELAEDSAVIAGSTMVQACLGVLWGKEGKKTYNDGRSDVDIFCSAKAAPAVRSWLVENSDCMFVGLRDSYVSLASSELLYSVDTNIHHVEHWGSISENVVDNGVYPGSLPPDIDAKNTDYYKEVVGYGKQCQSRYIEWKFQNGLHFDVLGIDQNKAYDVKTENGVDLPFDFAGEGNIDLVVGRLKDKSGNTKLTPGDLLSDFDLEICKCSFDGRKFRVADPHNTFSGRTAMEPNRRAVVGSYARHFFAPPAGRYTRDEAASAHAGAVIARVRADVRDAPFYGQLDRAADLRGHYSPDDLWDSETQLKFGASIQFHNFVVKLIGRLRKYQSRGIEVLDAPEIAEDKEFFSFSFGF